MGFLDWLKKQADDTRQAQPKSKYESVVAQLDKQEEERAERGRKIATRLAEGKITIIEAFDQCVRSACSDNLVSCLVNYCPTDRFSEVIENVDGLGAIVKRWPDAALKKLTAVYNLSVVKQQQNLGEIECRRYQKFGEAAATRLMGKVPYDARKLKSPEEIFWWRRRIEEINLRRSTDAKTCRKCGTFSDLGIWMYRVGYGAMNYWIYCPECMEQVDNIKMGHISPDTPTRVSVS